MRTRDAHKMHLIIKKKKQENKNQKSWKKLENFSFSTKVKFILENYVEKTKNEKHYRFSRDTPLDPDWKNLTLKRVNLEQFEDFNYLIMRTPPKKRLPLSTLSSLNSGLIKPFPVM